LKLLLINHYAGTPALGMEYRPYYLAREWVRGGHEVLIVAATQSHVRARQPSEGVERVDGITYRWIDTPPYSGNGVARARNIYAFVKRLWVDADTIAAAFRPDAVIASSTYPLDIWPARRIARAARAKLVFELHDLWPLSLIELAGMSPWHPFALVCQTAEDTAYRDADLVVSILPKVHAHVAARGIDAKKLVVVPNGVSPDDWDAPAEPLRDDVAAALRSAREGGAAVLGYAGAMGLPNALDVLLDAAALLRDVPVRIVMVGDGHERERLQRRVVDEALSNVALLAPVPKAQVMSFLRAIDIAYIGLQNQPLFRFGISPNKLMDYMMAARPVVQCIEAGNDPVSEAGCGVTVRAGSPQAAAEGIRKLVAMTPKQREAMGRRGRAYVLANHAYPVLAQRFLQSVRDLK
jgi:glycosyltransferase involved in cell wall biosynthesis